MVKYSLYVLYLVFLAMHEGSAIYCYRCTSATPGCADKFNWRGIGFLGEQCPETNDICVKVVERRGAKETITRDCLSALNFRTDIPADKYEGCRPAALDVHLANYVNHTIKEHDVKRDFYNHVTFCFCFLDHRCNDAESLVSPSVTALFGFASLVLALVRKVIF